MQFVYVHVVEVKDSVWETNEQFRYFANEKSQCHKRGASPDNDIRFIELRFFRSITIMQLRLAIPADRLADILCSLIVSLPLSICLPCLSRWLLFMHKHHQSIETIRTTQEAVNVATILFIIITQQQQRQANE